MNGFVYFIRPIGMRGPTKIGFSRWPETRLRDLALWSPFPLEIVLTIEGERSLEGRLHSQFHADHSHHEWFRVSEAIDAFLDAYACVGRMAIDYETPVRSLSARLWTPERRAEASKIQREGWARRREAAQ